MDDEGKLIHDNVISADNCIEKDGKRRTVSIVAGKYQCSCQYKEYIGGIPCWHELAVQAFCQHHGAIDQPLPLWTASTDDKIARRTQLAARSEEGHSSTIISPSEWYAVIFEIGNRLQRW